MAPLYKAIIHGFHFHCFHYNIHKFIKVLNMRFFSFIGCWRNSSHLRRVRLCIRTTWNGCCKGQRQSHDLLSPWTQVRLEKVSPKTWHWCYLFKLKELCTYNRRRLRATQHAQDCKNAVRSGVPTIFKVEKEVFLRWRMQLFWAQNSANRLKST